MSDNQVLNHYLQLRNRNLVFFQNVYPGIFEYFSQYQLQHSKLDIQPQNNEVDLLEEGRHVYQGARRYAPQEVAKFLNAFDYGKRIQSIKPLYKGDYKNKRFFAEHMDRAYQHSALTPEKFGGYEIPEVFPLTVFMGCGLGLHIELLIQQRDLQHVVVAENNMDHFMASLYVVDWETIVSPYLADEERSFRFILIPNAQTEQQLRDVIWNHLIDFCPFFPVMTFFYNHLGSPHFNRVIDSICADLYVHLFSFGNYDDELNQLNNAIHNFKQGVKRLPPPLPGGVNLPVCIVGSGPSLDERIEWLKALQGKALIISCGTALRALYKQGIKPDIQIELESDFKTFVTQNLTEDKEYMRSIKLIGAAQLTPRMFGLFDEKRLFFKAEGVLQGFFAAPGEAIAEAAPTCTNAALAFAFHYDFKQILLFGLDYGFPDKQQHHASGAVYYKEDGPDGLNHAALHEDANLFRVKGASGNDILTSNFLFASKRRTENIIQALNKGHIYNCSNGSHIENTQWLNEQTFNPQIFLTSPETKDSVIEYLFSSDARRIDDMQIQHAIENLQGDLEHLVSYLSTLLSLPLTSVSDMTALCHKINTFLLREYKELRPSAYFFIRGSVWHFLHAGFSHVCALKAKNDKQTFMVAWQNEFKDFIAKLSSHYQSVLFKDFDLKKDKLVNRSITDAETDALVPCLADYFWQPMDMRIDENGTYIEYKI
jgi:hypothetical protein